MYYVRYDVVDTCNVYTFSSSAFNWRKDFKFNSYGTSDITSYAQDFLC